MTKTTLRKKVTGDVPPVAELLERLNGIEALLIQQGPGPDGSPSYSAEFSDEALADHAAALYFERQRRAYYLDEDLLADPAWDMLLDLFVAKVRGRQVSSTSTCLAGKVPQATGLRWLAHLEARRLVERRRALNDARVRFVSITRMGYEAMRGYLDECLRLRSKWHRA